MSISWLAVVVDVPEGDFERDREFWQAVTASSPLKHDDVTTLVPDGGDPYLRMRPVRSSSSSGGCCLQILTDDMATLGEALVEGGGQTERSGPEVMAGTSPGGLRFDLLASHGALRRPSPRLWSYGQRSLVDQLCIDIPYDEFSDECDFWSALTGWEQRPGGAGFRYLPRPAAMPLRLLLQQLDDPRSGPVRSHLDLACSDVEAECRRHEELGATVAYEGEVWVTLHDPAGTPYCITCRDPDTGVL